MYSCRELLCNLWWWPLNLLWSWLVCKLVWNPSWFHGLSGYTGLSLLNRLLGGWFSHLISYNWSVLLQRGRSQKGVPIIHHDRLLYPPWSHTCTSWSKFMTCSINPSVWLRNIYNATYAFHSFRYRVKKATMAFGEDIQTPLRDWVCHIRNFSFLFAKSIKPPIVFSKQKMGEHALFLVVIFFNRLMRWQL
jgi:hypothetical protein